MDRKKSINRNYHLPILCAVQYLKNVSVMKLRLQRMNYLDKRFSAMKDDSL